MGAANARAIVDIYGPIASDYQEIWAPLLRSYGVRLLDRLPLDACERVLEVACGAGQLLSDIGERAPKRAQVIGVDLVEEMLRLGPPRIDRLVMDATALAFAERTFDVVVCAFALFHFPDPLAALVGIRRVLRPLGLVGTATWGSGGSFPALDVFGEELDASDAGPDPAEGVPDGMELIDSPAKMRSILADAGFRDIRVDAVPWEQRWELDAFIDYRTRLGPSRRRLETLEPGARAACLARIRQRLSALPDDALVDRDEVVLSTAARR
jgi:SAM-dependent methyltransferase